VSFDPVEWFLGDTTDERTWHDDPRDMPTGEIVAVGLLGEDLDTALAELPPGVTIPVLDLSNGRPTAASVAHLTRIRGLRCLTIGQHNAVVAVVGDLRELEYLLIEGEAVTDSSLVHLGRLTVLRHLGLIGIGIRGESGDSSRLPASLEDLDLTGTSVGDDGIRQLIGVASLRKLDLLWRLP
jgi:hypothetical protein